MKHRRGWRRKGIRWAYDGDGRYSPERIVGFWKRYWSRWLKRRRRSQGRDEE